MSETQHGTLTKYNHGCRCESCIAAHRVYQKSYYSATHQGVRRSADPVRAHLHELKNSGWKLRDVALVARITQPQLSRILHNPQKKISADVEMRILSVISSDLAR